jgi:LAS superfamily LD-carboxypeptidase LdcB
MASAKTPKPKTPTLTAVPTQLERHYHKLVLPSTLQHVTPGELPAGLLVDVKPYGKLHPLAADAYMALRDAAFAAGVKTFKPTSSGDCYRSTATQKAGFLARYQTQPIAGASTKTWNGVTYYLKPGNAMMAAPGTSRHNLGLAVDISDASAKDRMDFMLKNIQAYGFTWEVKSEPWHIFYYVGDRVPALVQQWKQAKSLL